MARSLVSDLAGRVLAGRYLLHSAIGTGASGRVYLAEDTRLRRRVAVKILHAALAEDSAFLRRFRAEAQVAASLQHPHIVTVHDWGEDDMPFMVLELLDGGSLRSILDQDTHLSVSQAARVGRDVASALEYAHARGILHRDVKPANLLFDEHGIVRVADFGLARALAEASWTEPAGAMFGTARYASPEQATGVQLDARSDLYSLALVIVESVTGRVPFTADTTIGTLTARTQHSLTAPEELGPLGPIVERAGRIDVSERYPDAATMRGALVDVGESLPPPGPLPLAGMIDGPDPHPTRTQAPAATAALFDQDADPVAVLAEVQPKIKRKLDSRRLVPFFVAAALVLTIALASIALAKVGGGTQVEVPGLVGYSVEAATAQADAEGFEIDVAEERHAPDPAGIIIDQSPDGGTFSDGKTVKVVVSTGPAPIAIPDIVNQPQADAENALRGAGFVLAAPKTDFSDSVPSGAVISVDPAVGTELPPESTVTLTVSQGRAPVQIPDVSTGTFDQAKAALEGLGFTVTQAPDEFSDSVPSGQVIGTNPDIEETVPYGSPVEIVVSKGPDLVTIPDLIGDLLGNALDRLTSSGFVPRVDGPVQFGRPVQDVDPGEGTQAPRGSEVIVKV